MKTDAKTKIGKRFDYVHKKLEGKPFLMGDTFTVADAYLFVMLDLRRQKHGRRSIRPNLAAFFDRVSKRPAVQHAIEGRRPGSTRRRA